MKNRRSFVQMLPTKPSICRHLARSRFLHQEFIEVHGQIHERGQTEPLLGFGVNPDTVPILYSAAVDNHRILIVDDDPNMLSMLRRTLGFEGYQVMLAADAETALR